MKLMNSSLGALVTIIGLAFTSGCKEEDPVPVQAEVKAVLLAGDAGSSKSWKLVTVTEKEGTGTEQTLTLPGCASDNIYKFSNNAAQDYEETEGATKCATADAATVEKGTWSFTLDGTIFVLANKLLTSSQTSFPFSSIFPYPAEVVELSDSILKLRMTYTYDGVTIVDNFTFNKN